jgi:hypothetical protein
MIHATLLALLTAAAPAEATSARALLKPAAAAEPACRATRVGELVAVPLFSPASAECPVASIEGEVIALRELADALEVGHMSHSPSTPAAAKKPDMDFTPALDRLITSRLIVREAREMRLDADPSFRANIDEFKASRLRAMLQQIAVKGVQPDAAEVERLYRDAVREWKLKSVLLEKEDVAKSFEAALKAGGSFDALAKKYIAEKKAKGGEKAEWVPPKQMLPEVRGVLEKAKPGVPTGLVKLPSGWAVMRVDGLRYPAKDAAARAAARATSIARVEREAVRRFYQSLLKKHATVDQALLDKLDFEANGEKGFGALLEDQRPLVKIAGEKPVVVADLAQEVGSKFFHGLEAPIREHRVNRQKAESFERLLGARLFAKEAAARKLDALPEYRREVVDYERALTFGAFVEKVIRPEVKVTEDEAMKYYEQQKAEFTAPQMYKLDGIAFTTAGRAQSALDLLNAGTDFPWLKTTATDQLPPEKCSLRFDGTTLSVNALPRGLAKALTGTSAGAYRLYAAGEAEVYVVRVVEQVAPAPQPYVEAREKIAKKIYADKITQAIRDYADKLRKVQHVDVLISRITL